MDNKTRNLKERERKKEREKKKEGEGGRKKHTKKQTESINEDHRNK